MRLFNILVFIIFQNLILFGQKTLITDNSIPLEKGFYRDFYEFKYNKPSIPFEYRIDTISQNYGGIKIEGQHIKYGLTIKKEHLKLLRNIFGFCDGNNVYILVSQDIIKQKMIFERLDFIGRYCLFSYVILKNKLPVYLSNGLAREGVYFSIPIKYGLGDFIVDLNEGHSFFLNQNFVEETIKKDIELNDKFKADPSKEKKLREFIIAYSLKHVDEIKVSYDELTTGEIVSILNMDSSDSTFEMYYNRLMIQLPKTKKINNIKLWESKYGNGNYKFIGLSGYHNLNLNPEYKYKFGIWQYFYKNGDLKREILYDIKENKLYEKIYAKKKNNI
jgi:hypothetical protein